MCSFHSQERWACACVGTLWPAPCWLLVPAMAYNVQTEHCVLMSAARAASAGALLNTSSEVYIGNTRLKCFLYLYPMFCKILHVCLFTYTLAFAIVSLFLLPHSFYLLFTMFKFARCCYHMHSSEIYWFRSPHSWHSWQTPKRYPSPIWKIITKYQQTKSWVDTETRSIFIWTISLTHPTTTGKWF